MATSLQAPASSCFPYDGDGEHVRHSPQRCTRLSLSPISSNASSLSLSSVDNTNSNRFEAVRRLPTITATLNVPEYLVLNPEAEMDIQRSVTERMSLVKSDHRVKEDPL